MKLARQCRETRQIRVQQAGLAAALIVALVLPALAQPRGSYGGRRPGGMVFGKDGAPMAMPPGADDAKAVEGPPPPPGGKAPGAEGGPGNSAKTRPFDPENLPKENKGLISMTFENADIGAVLRALSTIWGKTIAIHPSLQGSITVISAKEVTPAESLEIMRTALNVHGFTLIGGLDDKTKILEVWPRRDAANQGTIVQQGNDPNQVQANIQIVTQVVEIKYLPAHTLGETLKPLLNKEHASIVTLEDSNNLVITDTGINIKRMLEIIALVDKLPDDRRAVEVVRLVHANATEVQKLLNDMFSNPLAALRQQLQRGGRGGGGDFGGGMPGGGEGMMQMLQAGGIKATDTVKITADVRTNSLVLYGPPETLKTLRETITQLDQDVSRQVVFKRYQLQFADAAQISSSLNQLFQQPEGGASRMPSWFRRWGGDETTQPDRGFTSLKENLVVPDLRTNSLLITATPENQRIYEELIKSMDQPSQVQDVVEVIPLEFAKASTVQTSLSRLLRGSNNDRGWMFFVFGDQRSTDSPLQQLRDVTVVAEETSNSLIVSGPAESLPIVRRLVSGLDQPQAQVYISVIIADVTLNDTQNLGVELSWTHAPLKGDTAATNLNLNQNITQGIRYALVHDEFSALLKALSDKQRVKVLSTPHVTGVNNKQASISIGQRFPFPSSQSAVNGTVVANFDLKDIVVKLDVLPRVSLGSQMVTLSVDQQIDELTGTVKQGNFDLPLIATRRATTDVMVESGQTVVIGGIIRDKVDKQRTGVPFLQDLPILGPLFRSTKDHQERTELMVFLTPFVVTTEEQLRNISEQRQQQLDTEFPALREYIRSQEQMGSEKPPVPKPVPPDPKPMPRPDPTPRTQGAAPSPAAPTPAAPTTPRAAQAPAAEPASRPVALPVEAPARLTPPLPQPVRTVAPVPQAATPRIAAPPLTTTRLGSLLPEPAAGGMALEPDVITPDRIALAMGLPPMPPLEPLLSNPLTTDGEALRLASAPADVMPGLWGAWSGLLDPLTPSAELLPLPMTRVVLPAEAPATPPAITLPSRVVLGSPRPQPGLTPAAANPTRLVRTVDGRLVNP